MVWCLSTIVRLPRARSTTRQGPDLIRISRARIGDHSSACLVGAAGDVHTVTIGTVDNVSSSIHRPLLSLGAGLARVQHSAEVGLSRNRLGIQAISVVILGRIKRQGNGTVLELPDLVRRRRAAPDDDGVVLIERTKEDHTHKC